MSAVDQAFIKAYAKDNGPVERSPAPADDPARRTDVRNAFVRMNSATAGVEQTYADGSWYRLDPALSVARAPAAHTAFPQVPRAPVYAPPEPPANPLVRPWRPNLPNMAPVSREDVAAPVAAPAVSAPAAAAPISAPVAPPTAAPAPVPTSQYAAPRVEAQAPVALPPESVYAPPAPRIAVPEASFYVPTSTLVMNVDWQLPPEPEPKRAAPVVVPKAPPPVAPVPVAPPAPAVFAPPPVATPPAPPPAVQAVVPAVSEGIVTGAAPVATAPPVVQAFVPAWEVDAFLWPPACDRLWQTSATLWTELGLKLRSAVREGLCALVVTSARRGEGRSTIALCLARSAAKAGVRVALVDADTENARLAELLGIDVKAGWEAAIANQASLADVAVWSISDRVTVLPHAPSLRHRTDARVVASVVRVLREQFDLLIFDAPPMDSDSAAWLGECGLIGLDAGLVVRDVRSTSHRQILSVTHWLQAAGLDTVGIAENFAT